MTQLFIFARCAFAGFCAGATGGAIYSFLRVFKWGRSLALTALFDFLTFASALFLFCFFSTAFDFGAIRGYMIAACLLGIIIYRKSLGITLDFCAETLYNNIRKQVLTKRKSKGKTKWKRLKQEDYWLRAR